MRTFFARMFRLLRCSEVFSGFGGYPVGPIYNKNQIAYRNQNGTDKLPFWNAKGTDEAELCELTDSTLNKLFAMSDKDYKNWSCIPILMM